LLRRGGAVRNAQSRQQDENPTQRFQGHVSIIFCVRTRQCRVVPDSVSTAVFMFDSKDCIEARIEYKVKKLDGNC
jgi:hypothetical protein